MTKCQVTKGGIFLLTLYNAVTHCFRALTLALARLSCFVMILTSHDSMRSGLKSIDTNRMASFRQVHKDKV